MTRSLVKVTIIGAYRSPFSETLLFSNVIALIGSVLSFLSVTLSVPELFFASRVVASMSSGISFGALILFLQV